MTGSSTRLRRPDRTNSAAMGSIEAMVLVCAVTLNVRASPPALTDKHAPVGQDDLDAPWDQIATNEVVALTIGAE